MSQIKRYEIVRKLPIIVGSLGAFLLLINRLFTDELTLSQSRSDVLAVILSSILILTGLLWQKIQPIPPDTVNLIGEEKFELAEDLPENIKIELAWMSHLLLTNTVTRSLVICYEGKVLLKRGILGTNPEVKLGAIAQRVLEKEKPVYLVDVKVYPGRIEFDYLPENIQGIICQNIGNKGVMILGANAPRSYTIQDENWIAGMAQKLANSLKS